MRKVFLCFITLYVLLIFSNSLASENVEDIKKKIEVIQVNVDKTSKAIDDTVKAIEEKQNIETQVNDTKNKIKIIQANVDKTAKAIEDTTKAIDDIRKTAKAIEETTKKILTEKQKLQIEKILEKFDIDRIKKLLLKIETMLNSWKLTEKQKIIVWEINEIVKVIYINKQENKLPTDFSNL